MGPGQPPINEEAPGLRAAGPAPREGQKANDAGSPLSLPNAVRPTACPAINGTAVWQSASEATTHLKGPMAFTTATPAGLVLNSAAPTPKSYA